MRIFQRCCAGLVALALAMPAAFAEGSTESPDLFAHLVRDINTTPQPGAAIPLGFVAGPTRVYFVATTPETGRELFSADGSGSDAGLRLEADVVPGTASSNIETGQIFPGSNTVYFVADLDDERPRLFALDTATHATTELPIPPIGGLTLLAGVRLVGDRLFFVPSGDGALWTSDGTIEGTVALTAALGADAVVPDSLSGDDGTLYFIADGTPHARIWTSDGTVEGTQPRAELESHAYLACTTVDGGAYWAIVGSTVYRYDIGAATVADVGHPPSTNPYDCRIVALDGAIYYFASSDVPPATALWRSTGIANGTSEVAPVPNGAGPQTLTATGNGLLFWSDVLWRSDGTAAGTGPMMTSDGTLAPTSPTTCCFRKVDAGFLFLAGSNAGYGYWVTDGSSAGTHVVSVNTGPSIDDGATLDGKLIGMINPYIVPPVEPDLWVSDGTAAGTRAIATIWPATGDSLWDLTDLQGVAFDGDTLLMGKIWWGPWPPYPPYRLWKSDGTEAGTINLSPDLYGGESIGFVAAGVGHKTIFTADRFYVADETFQHIDVIDGSGPGTFAQRYESPAGPNILFTCNTGDYPSVCTLDATLHNVVTLLPPWVTEAHEAGDIGGVALFFVTWFDPTTGGNIPWTLWRSDGTQQGTYKLTVLIPPAANGYYERIFATHNGRLYFTACATAEVDCGVYVSDGSTSATRIAGIGGKTANSFAFIGDRMVFLSGQPGGNAGDRLWSYDTANGGAPQLLLDRSNPNVHGYLSALAEGRDSVRFAFIATNCSIGCTGTLWNTDGTLSGTQQMPGALPWSPSGVVFLAYDADRSVFTCSAPDIGEELCQTDGTAVGTRLIRDINPGPNVPWITARKARNRIYFAADDGHHGREIWTIDGEALFSDGFEAH